jgi:regulatory protein
VESGAAPDAFARSRARACGLRLLAARRLTEAQLWSRLSKRGFGLEEIRAAVETLRRDGFLDDRLFATLSVETRLKSLGNARLIADLVRKGVDRALAVDCVRNAERGEEERIAEAADRLYRLRPQLSYPSAAQSLERLGFPAPLIYRHLRLRAKRLGFFADDPFNGRDLGAFEDSVDIHA